MTNYGPQPTPTTSSGRHDQAGIPPQPAGWRGVSPLWWLAVGVAAVAVIILAILWLGSGLDDDAQATRNLSVSDVVQDGASMVGDQAVLTGRIDELLTDRALAVGSDLAADDVLVIVSPDARVRGYGLSTGASLPLTVGETYETGNVVQFTGTLHEFDRAEMVDEYDIVLNEEIFAEYEGEPALVVDRLDVATYGRPVLVDDASSS
ncbi:MAG: hypothetical protein AB1Z67_09975 [Candidatus Limnocylindrales bacterium]